MLSEFIPNARMPCYVESAPKIMLTCDAGSLKRPIDISSMFFLLPARKGQNLRTAKADSYGGLLLVETLCLAIFVVLCIRRGDAIRPKRFHSSRLNIFGASKVYDQIYILHEFLSHIHRLTLSVALATVFFDFRIRARLVTPSPGTWLRAMPRMSTRNVGAVNIARANSGASAPHSHTRLSHA